MKQGILSNTNNQRQQNPKMQNPHNPVSNQHAQLLKKKEIIISKETKEKADIAKTYIQEKYQKLLEEEKKKKDEEANNKWWEEYVNAIAKGKGKGKEGKKKNKAKAKAEPKKPPKKKEYQVPIDQCCWFHNNAPRQHCLK